MHWSHLTILRGSGGVACWGVRRALCHTGLHHWLSGVVNMELPHQVWVISRQKRICKIYFSPQVDDDASQEV